MKKKRNIILVTLFCLTAFIIFAPLLQQHLKLFKFGVLTGYNQPTPKPKFSYDSYVSGKYQRQSEKYLKENFGFREPLIRMYNQWAYDWFKTTSNREISIGKDGWLYHTESALQYHGNMVSWFDMTNSEVRENLVSKARVLAKVNAILKQYDVHLLTFTLPTKSFIYPEHLRWQPIGDTTFNATPFFEQQLCSLGVPHINMVPWFKQVQDTTPFDLYYSKGSHWAAGAPLAVDTMLRYMEQIGDQPLAHIQVGTPYSIDEIPSNDKDLELLLNLASPLKHEPIYEYPVSLVTDEHTQYPSVWFVGTSFYWYLTRRVNFDALFRDRDFLFYYATFYTNREQNSFPADNLDYLHELLLHDYVVFFRDGPQLYNNGLLFPGKALISLCISDERLKEKTNAIADSICHAWQAKTHYDSLICYNEANIMLERQPELFEELRGEGIPACRNPRIGQILVERKIHADRNWSFLINAKANNDSLNVRDLFRMESYNATNHQPLLRDNTYFTSYDYLDFLVEEAVLDIYRSQAVSGTKDEVFQQALDTIKTRIQRHVYDDDTLMITACAMDAIIKDISTESNLSSIREKAKNWHVSIDKAFRKDALWCCQHAKDKKQFLNEETLIKALDAYNIEHRMRQTEEAMESLMQQHNKLNMPLRMVINRNIEWIQQNRVQ